MFMFDAPRWLSIDENMVMVLIPSAVTFGGSGWRASAMHITLV
jgi:hypothetical protein